MVDKLKKFFCTSRLHVEPAAPNVERPRLPDAEINQPMHDDVVEYPDGASGDLVREMKRTRHELLSSSPTKETGGVRSIATQKAR